MELNQQWPQALIDRMIPLRDRSNLLASVIHARDYLRESSTFNVDTINAIEILSDGIMNVLDSHATGLEWWTLRHRLSHAEIQSGSWQDTIKTS